MLLTEEQARKTRCCGPYDTGFREPAKGMTVIFDRYCIGSDCMAWRWVSERLGTRQEDTFETVNLNKGKGYCGLAGMAIESGASE